jgi:hypothetical protein
MLPTFFLLTLFGPFGVPITRLWEDVRHYCRYCEWELAQWYNNTGKTEVIPMGKQIEFFWENHGDGGQCKLDGYRAMQEDRRQK